MISAARLAAIFDAMGSLTAHDLAALPRMTRYTDISTGNAAHIPLGNLVVDLFMHGDDVYRQGLADLVSMKLGDQPVAWRGHHLHPKAHDTWTYVDGAERPKAGLGGLVDLEPLFREA